MKSLYKVIFISLCFLNISVFDVLAAKSKTSKSPKKAATTYSAPPETSLVIDMEQGKVLHAQNAHLKIYPASLTKVMTLYLAFEALDQGKLSMNQKIPVSSRAENMRPSKLGLRKGEHIMVHDAVMGLIVKSANDAAVVLAEAIGGSSEDHFAKMMTKRAHDLGMRDTTFRNASGWHHPEQKTTAIDLAKLTLALKRDFPKYYTLFAKTSFVFKGQTINGHNRVMQKYAGAEGLKTGFTGPAGFNLITTASRGDKALVGVVTGGKSGKLRDNKMMALLDRHFGVPPKIEKKLASASSSRVTKVSMTKNKMIASKKKRSSLKSKKQRV